VGSKAFGGLNRRLKEKTAESRWFETTGQAPFGRAKAAYWKIKAFAALRKGIGGTSTEKGIQEYLALLSICETCKYKGVSFLEFLRTGEKDIDTFIKKGARVSKESGFPTRLPK